MPSRLLRWTGALPNTSLREAAWRPIYTIASLCLANGPRTFRSRPLDIRIAPHSLLSANPVAFKRSHVRGSSRHDVLLGATSRELYGAAPYQQASRAQGLSLGVQGPTMR